MCKLKGGEEDEQGNQENVRNYEKSLVQEGAGNGSYRDNFDNSGAYKSCINL